MLKSNNYNRNSGNAYIRYLGANMYTQSSVVYQRVRVLEILPDVEEDSLFLVFSNFTYNSLAINFKWLIMYEFLGNNWSPIETSMGSITNIYVSNNEILFSGKFDYQNKIDCKYNYLEAYDFTTIFNYIPIFSQKLKNHDIDFKDFSILSNWKLSTLISSKQDENYLYNYLCRLLATKFLKYISIHSDTLPIKRKSSLLTT